jgi:hypothetical protein
MRALLLLFLFTSSFGISQELDDLRVNYPKANTEASVTDRLYESLSEITKANNKTIVAYKGAVLTLKAKHAKGFKNKKTFFKEGAELLEYAIASEPKNIEIRCLRLGVQENAPKIVGYKKSIQVDKQFIKENYATIQNENLKDFIKGYVMLSDAFTDTEKQLF